MISEMIVAPLASLVTLLLNISYTNHRVSKERRSATLQSLIQKIEEIDELARLYFVSDPSSESCKHLGQRIKSRIQSIARTINKINYKKYGLDKASVQSKLIQFRKSVTGGDFEEASRAASARDDRRMTSISFASSELINVFGCDV